MLGTFLDVKTHQCRKQTNRKVAFKNLYKLIYWVGQQVHFGVFLYQLLVKAEQTFWPTITEDSNKTW